MLVVSILVSKAQKPINRLNDVVVKDIKEPVDIAAFSIARCLFVCDSKENYVWRVKNCFDEMLVDKFLERVAVSSLSVSTDGHIPVVGLNNYIASLRIFVYSHDGEIRTVIDLKGFQQAMHAAGRQLHLGSLPTVTATPPSTVFTN